jgi:hypothetical protein
MLKRTTLGIISLIAVPSGCGLGYTHVSDEKMILRFNDNEAVFDALRNMGLQDVDFRLISPRMVTRLVPGSPSDGTNGGMDPNRFAEYMRLFEQLGLEDGIIRSDQSVWFGAEARSWRNGSVTKGYVYSTGKIGPLVPDLDSFVPQPTSESRRPRFLVFRILKPNWYLYKSSDG